MCVHKKKKRFLPLYSLRIHYPVLPLGLEVVRKVENSLVSIFEIISNKKLLVGVKVLDCYYKNGKNKNF